MLDFIEGELGVIKREGLYRSLRRVEGHQGPKITIDGKDCVNLCSNNYLGLANNPRLKQAAIEAVQKYGAGSGASRLVCGNLKLCEELETRIARFKAQEAALVFTSGYAANLGAITALVGRGDIVFSDRLNHASIIDAVILSRAELKRYPHKDAATLENMLKNQKPGAGNQKRLIITDTLFSMDGDLAPLPELVELAKRYNCILMADEAHATGVFGEGGGGAAEHFGLKDEIDVHMGTLSKALGSMGGYICGRKALIEYLINKSRPFIYTTAPAPSVMAPAIAAIDIIRTEEWLRKALWSNVWIVKNALIDLGFDIMGSGSQIIPILVGESEKAVEFSRALFEEGIFIQAIRPPTVPEGEARLRLTVMATHKKQDLEKALEIIGKTGKHLGII